ncbi:hypothetical protein [Hydrogenophaga aquatica]
MRPFPAPFAPARASLTLAAAVLFTLSAPAQAQPGSAQGQVAQEPVRTLEQKTERITHEDAGSRIEELRVGGQTRSIDVQTKTAVPGYQVQPIDPSQADDSKGKAGKSSWRLLNF